MNRLRVGVALGGAKRMRLDFVSNCGSLSPDVIRGFRVILGNLACGQADASSHLLILNSEHHEIQHEPEKLFYQLAEA
jgi:hypothetical protein